MEKDEGGGVLVVKGRATIDMRPPFRSVKEAVALFGERVLVGQVYAKQLKEVEVQVQPNKATTIHKEKVASTITAELEETKQDLEKTREEGNYLANCLKSLKQELEQTKKELLHMKSSKNIVFQHSKTVNNPEIEDLKFVEISAAKQQDFDDENRQWLLNQHDEQHKKKFVTFASPPSLTREIIHNKNNVVVVENMPAEQMLGRTPSLRKEGKKKAVNPVLGWLFPSKKRNLHEGDYDCSPKK